MTSSDGSILHLRPVLDHLKFNTDVPRKSVFVMEDPVDYTSEVRRCLLRLRTW